MNDERRWYLGSLNDGRFIIDAPPRPSNDDAWHDRPDGPSLVVNVVALSEEHAQAIVDAHNASIDLALTATGPGGDPMTIDADRLANLRSRIERAEDAVANLDGSGLWAERYAGDVAFLLGALAATGPARRLESAAAILRDVAEVAACSETEGGPDGCEGCRARAWLEGAATGPGCGAPPEEHVGLRTAPACALTADECHRENGIPCAAHSHSLATPPSGGWATPSASGFPVPSAGELGFRKDLSATPPSGSPPGAAETCLACKRPTEVRAESTDATLDGRPFCGAVCSAAFCYERGSRGTP